MKIQPQTIGTITPSLGNRFVRGMNRGQRLVILSLRSFGYHVELRRHLRPLCNGGFMAYATIELYPIKERGK